MNSPLSTSSESGELSKDLQEFLADLDEKSERGDFNFHFRKRTNTGPACADDDFDPAKKRNEWIETFRGLRELG